MAHYAYLDENNIVTSVIVGKDETENNIDWEKKYSEFKGKTCKRTSYNTEGNVHIKGGIPFRKNFAQPGYIYDSTRDAFIPPKPYESWSLNEETCLWQPPTPYPAGEQPYQWNEETQTWDLITNG